MLKHFMPLPLNHFKILIFNLIYFFFLLSKSFAGSAPEESFSWNEFKIKPVILKSGRFTKHCFDLNQDRKLDFCQFVDKDNYISRIEKDSNFTGTIDWIEEYGSNKHPRFERRIYKSSNLSEKTVLKSFAEISYLETQLFTNNKLIETHVKLIVTQNSESCSKSQLQTFFQQISSLNQNLAYDNAGFLNTKYGLRIHKSCIDARGGAQIALKEYSEALHSGLQCLQNLNTSKSNEHVVRFFGLFNSQPKPKVVCNEDSFNWAGANAHATASPADQDHPLISMNPKTCKEWKSKSAKNTYFHELFHNLGCKDIDIYSSQPYNKALYDSAKIIVDAEDSSIKPAMAPLLAA
ncbi:MAG: hypothetical protein J0M15_11105 [Deltaproteobacteria bacterium]|nr:hypothetical protein [Deltaproteobacteria bacterium]